MKVVYSGSIGRFPIGGHSWFDMQWLAGLHELGLDVYYVEDCGDESWVYDWEAEALTNQLDYPAEYVRRCLAGLGFEERWTYRAGDETRGRPLPDLLDFCTDAELLVVSAVPLAKWRPEYSRIRRKVFIDVDPGFNQIDMAKGAARLNETADRCDLLFTIGRRIGLPDCAIPTAGREWHVTAPPVSLNHWPAVDVEDELGFTTVMQWRGFHEVEWQGVRYGQKDREFPRFRNLPSLTPETLCLALTGADPRPLTKQGWRVVSGWRASATPAAYQEFIQRSRAELSIVKHGYAAMRGGWFSDRSICYLASGRPVLVQDTGLHDWLPVGQGVLTFHDAVTAAAAIARVCEDYATHRVAARRIAEEFFDGRSVLASFLDTATG